LAVQILGNRVQRNLRFLDLRDDIGRNELDQLTRALRRQGDAHALLAVAHDAHHQIPRRLTWLGRRA